MCQAELATDPALNSRDVCGAYSLRRGFLAGDRLSFSKGMAKAKWVALGHPHLNLLLNGKHVNHSGEQLFGFVASRRGVLRLG